MNPQEREEQRKQIGEKIRNAREKLRLTQKQVAKQAGVNPSYYAQIERGEVNPSIDKLQDIAEILKIKTLDIL